MSHRICNAAWRHVIGYRGQKIEVVVAYSEFTEYDTGLGKKKRIVRSKKKLNMSGELNQQ